MIGIIVALIWAGAAVLLLRVMGFCADGDEE